MKQFYKLLMVLCLIVKLTDYKAQFSGAFAPANWGTVAVNSNGITNATGAPISIYMTSGDGGSGVGTNDYTITVPQTGIITFNWNYSTVDGPQYDYPQYIVNGVANMLTGYSTSGGNAQSGSQACISVTVGQVFGFRMYTVDNFGGPATTTFSSLYFSTGSLTITPASPTVCPGSTLALTATGGTNYVWSGGITNGVMFTPTASGVYTVTSGTSGCNFSKTVAVTYNPPLTISGPTSNICANSSATLTGAGGTTYTWSTGAVSSSIVITPSITSSYTISGVSSQGCNTAGAKTVTVDPGIPVVTASTSSSGAGVCPGKTLTLNGGGATTYTWTGGSPTVTNGIAFALSTTTGYTVTGGNSCGTGTAAITVSIHPLPSVTGVASTASLCSGANLTLTGVGTATSYAWSGWTAPIINGGGFAPSTTTTYTVVGTSALTCTASATVPVTVVTTPNAFPTANPALICIGKSSVLTALGATNYTWASASQTVFTSSFTVTPAVFGTSTYTITKSNSNCVDTKTISVVTNSLPTIFAIVTPTVVCALTPATLAVGGGQSYTWTAPGPPSYTFTGASPVISPAASSIYTVAATDGTCINTTTVFLAANPNPTITSSASSSAICVGQSVTVTALGGVNYTWTSTANTNTSSLQTFTDSPTVSVSYNVTGDNSFGCIAGTSQILIVNPNPTLNISATKTLVCSGGPSTLTASGANTYSWDPNANNALTAATIVNPTSPTSGFVLYTVEGTYTATGCKSTKAIAINVFVPLLTVTGTTNTCYGGPINLAASGGNNGSYSWNTGSGTPYNFPSLSTTLAAAAVFTVTATTTSVSVNCPASQTVAVGIFYNPTITAVAQRTTICRYESVNIYGNGGVTYQWNNAMTGGTINVSPSINTTYTVTGTDANGCVNTGTVQVKVSGCTAINELSASNSGLIIYPNPNNGEFSIQSNEKLTVTLVNELGQTIRTIDLSGVTNYKVSITDLAKGIYFISGQKDGIQINQKVIVTK